MFKKKQKYSEQIPIFQKDKQHLQPKKIGQRNYYGYENRKGPFSKKLYFGRVNYDKQFQPRPNFNQIQRRNAQKQRIMQQFEQPRSPVGITQYIPLTHQDLMYLGNLQRYKSEDFQIIITKITEDLNFLLYFKYQHFWQQLTKCESLRKALYSYLLNLPRPVYQTHVDKNAKVKQDPLIINNLFQNKNFLMFRQLFRIVLFIYHRIVCQSKPHQKYILYQYWLFDIPKMLNLISIYKQNNLNILMQILNTAFIQIPSYQSDVQQFAAIFVSKVLPALDYDYMFQFIQSKIIDNKNFANPMESFTRNLMRTFFRSYDVFNNLCDVIDFFPPNYTLIVLSQPSLIVSLIEVYFKYCQKTQFRWQLTQQFKKLFTPTIHKIRQKMVEFFLKALELIDNALQETEMSDIWRKCLYVYFIICKRFFRRAQTRISNRWQSFINLLISETPNRKFFRYDNLFQEILYPQEIKIIQYCINYQIKIRKQLNRTSFSNNEVLQIILCSIKSFKEWKEFQNLKGFDFVGQNQLLMGSVLQEDSVLQIIQKQMCGNLQKKKEGLHLNLYDRDRVHKRLKRIYFPEFVETQYNDEPMQQSKECIEAYCSIGLEALQQTQNLQQAQMPDNKPSNLPNSSK